MSTLEVTKETMVAAARGLVKDPRFKLLQGRWVALRWEIESRGKKERKPENWAELDGFDRAVQEVTKWAAKDLTPKKQEAPEDE